MSLISIPSNKRVQSYHCGKKTSWKKLIKLASPCFSSTSSGLDGEGGDGEISRWLLGIILPVLDKAMLSESSGHFSSPLSRNN